MFNPSRLDSDGNPTLESQYEDWMISKETYEFKLQQDEYHKNKFENNPQLRKDHWIFRRWDSVKLVRWFYEWFIAYLQHPYEVDWKTIWYECKLVKPQEIIHDVYISIDELVN